MTNIQGFNILCLGILNHLYDNFPKKVELKPASICEIVLPNDLNFEEAFNASALASETIDFLDAEGLIACGQKVYGGFLNVRLTMKGLAVLNAIPSSLQEKTAKNSSIERIKELFSKAIDSSASKASEEIIGTIFRYMLSS
ncbi:MAG: hypothetical protein Q7U44_07060 [Desulfuromonadales bacterium]|nr:hypothetical protein [Desulfuromonadales bacterium]